ncbi:MAG: response regulator transcription factor [Flavobacteriales bacterium]|nr:MAG: response regulator transcription factor [Flavobacteriales bacterium]
MARAMQGIPCGFWWTVVPYGAALAALVLLLRVMEYKFWMRDLPVEGYVGAVAVVFAALGAWAGAKLPEGRRKEAPRAAQPLPHEEAVRARGISGRELDVLQLMAQGRSNQEIADKLFISLPTVKSHASSLFRKLAVRRRTEAVHEARTLGLIP